MPMRNAEFMKRYIGRTISDIEDIGDPNDINDPDGFVLEFTDGTSIDISAQSGIRNNPYLWLDPLDEEDLL